MDNIKLEKANKLDKRIEEVKSKIREFDALFEKDPRYVGITFKTNFMESFKDDLRSLLCDTLNKLKKEFEDL